MVLAVVVVISHIKLVLLGGVDSRSGRFFYTNVLGGVVVGLGGELLSTLTVVRMLRLCSVLPCGVFYSGSGLAVSGRSGVVVSITLGVITNGIGTLTILSLGEVDLGGSVVGGRAVDSVQLSVVGLVFDVDLSVDVTLEGLLVSGALSSGGGCLVVLDVVGWGRGGRVVLLNGRRVTVGLRALVLLLLVMVFGLVDVDLLLVQVCWAAVVQAFLFVDADFFFDDVLVALRAGRGEGVIASFVTFPSDVRSLLRVLYFSLYLDFCCFLCCDSVTPIRGREDTEGDRDAGVKVQVDWSRGVLS